nr:mediator of RNA polymerase II transcription subunit 12 isoform X1 [Tanacetum cinerariifolium]
MLSHTCQITCRSSWNCNKIGGVITNLQLRTPIQSRSLTGKTPCSVGVWTHPISGNESHAHVEEEKVGVLLLNLGVPETLNDVQLFLYSLFADLDIIRLPRLFRFLQRPLAKLISTLRAPKSKESINRKKSNESINNDMCLSDNEEQRPNRRMKMNHDRPSKTSNSKGNDVIKCRIALDSTLYDREVPESLQNELDWMQLPYTDTVRWRIQTAMPFIFPSVELSICCQPSNVSVFALGFLQPSILIPRPHPVSLINNQVSLSRNISNGPSKDTKPLSSQPNSDIEIDPWTILEDGAGSCMSSINTAAIAGCDHANMRTLSWLKGV